MTEVKEERKGELFILAHMGVIGVSPVVIALSFTVLSPLTSLAWGVLVAAVFFAIVLTIRGLWNECAKPGLIRNIIGIAFFNVFLFHVLFFVGLEHTTAGNASILLLMEVFTSFVFFTLFGANLYHRSTVLGQHLWF